MDGENIGGIRIPLAVTDRIIEAADRADQEAIMAGKQLECEGS